MEEPQYPHRPVLVDEVVKALMRSPAGVYVDGTVGSGGHSEAILRSLAGEGRLICLDRDSDAVLQARQRLAPFGGRVTVLKGSYADLDAILAEIGLAEVDGVLLDLGVSSYQIEHSGRGFSFAREEPLDMRMDQESPVTAGQLINRLPLKEMETILRDYGEEPRAKRIVKAVGERRRLGGIESSLQLAEIIRGVVPRSGRPGAKHPATRTFQALRIAVNRELENLDVLLGKLPSLIRRGGRLVVLSYHSLEDRMVKQAMIEWEKGCICPPDLPRCACGKTPLFRRLSRKAVRPSQEEVRENPRARSAVLRAAERV
ncbi:MAG: 16S rRNA (cytosine(1402)-N(4))-methyltransferase RsmH [Thermodesulfobacteriota bacterium]